MTVFLAGGCKAAFALHPFLWDPPNVLKPQVGQMQNGVIETWDVKELAGKIVERQWKEILMMEGSLDKQQHSIGHGVFGLCLPIYVADWLHRFREKCARLPEEDLQGLVVQNDAWEQK